MSALIAAAPNHQARLLILEQWGAGHRVSEALALEPRDLRLDTAQPHPAARGRITLGPTRANKSYNPTYQPGASPTG